MGSDRPGVDRDATGKTLQFDRAVARRRQILKHLGSIDRIATEVDLQNIVADRLDAQSVEFLNVAPSARASGQGSNLRDERLGIDIRRTVRIRLTDLTPGDHRQLRPYNVHRIGQALVIQDVLPGLQRNVASSSLDVPQEQVACGLRAKVRVVGIQSSDRKIALAHQVQASWSRGLQPLVDRQRILARQGDIPTSR